MGLLRGIVLSADRRGTLAILAISISVAYALVAGAAVTGLSQAQETLSGDLLDTSWVVQRPDISSFQQAALPGTPETALRVDQAGDWTVYAVATGTPGITNSSRVLAGPTTGLSTATNVTLQGAVLEVETGDLAPGAWSTWLELTPDRFEELFPATQGLHVAIFEDLSENDRETLQADGFQVHRAPGALPYYVGGTEQLIGAVGATVLASAIVVGLLATGFIQMELRARRESLATLQFYGGPELVRRTVLGRGLLLLIAGHALGLLWVTGLLWVLARTGVLELALDPTFVTVALSATLVGGLVGLWPPLASAGRRLRADELGTRSPSGWLPHFLRPVTTSWRILLPLTISAMILAASLGLLFGVVDLPGQLFGTSGEQVIADTGGNPLRGTVSAFLGTHLAGVDGYEAASPEIFVPTVLDGRPVMVRGVDSEQVTPLDEVVWSQGLAPARDGDIALGDRLARNLGLQVGDQVTVPGSYRPVSRTLEVVGIFQADGLLADEALVTLPTARVLTGLGPDEVNMVRFRTTPTDEATGPPPVPTRLEVTGLSLTPEDPVPFEQATVTVEVVNFDQITRTRQLTLRVNGDPVATSSITLAPETAGTTTLTFTTPGGGLLNLEVNPQLNTQTGDPAYRIQAPPAASVDGNVTVTVETLDGAPADQVIVTLDEAQATTDTEGQARLSTPERGNRTILVEGPEGRAARTLLVVAPEDLHRAHAVIREVTGPDRVRATWEGMLRVENIGAETHNGTLTLPVNETDPNGTTARTSTVRILPGQTSLVNATVTLPPGTHTLGPEGARLQVVATGNRPTTGPGDLPTDPEEMTLEELLELRRQRGATSQEARADATSAFLGDTFENLNTALTVITLATVLHAGLITVVAVQRELEQHAAAVGTLTAIGGGPAEVRARALREHALVGTVAALLGTVLGLAAVWAGAELSWLTGFGHALSPRTDPGFALRLAAGAVATTLLAALLAVESIRGRTTGRLLAHGPTRGKRPPLDDLLEGPT